MLALKLESYQSPNHGSDATASGCILYIPQLTSDSNGGHVRMLTMGSLSMQDAMKKFCSCRYSHLLVSQSTREHMIHIQQTLSISQTPVHHTRHLPSACPPTCSAPSPPLNTTRLCRMRSCSVCLPLVASASCFTSASAALPLNNLP